MDRRHNIFLYLLLWNFNFLRTKCKIKLQVKMSINNKLKCFLFRVLGSYSRTTNLFQFLIKQQLAQYVSKKKKKKGIVVTFFLFVNLSLFNDRDKIHPS